MKIVEAKNSPKYAIFCSHSFEAKKLDAKRRENIF
jgi:hypothetical protein